MSVSLEARVAALEAERGARDAITRYARALDACDLDGIAALMAERVVFESGGVYVVGADQLLAHLAAVITGRAWAAHVVGAICVEMGDDGSPVAEAPFIFLARSGSALRVSAGRYHARFAAPAGGTLRFTNLRIEIGLNESRALPGA